MMAGIIRWSSQNILIVLMVTVFAIAAGVYAVINTPLDAIPDLSDPQVIVYTEYPGQAPQVVEDQITYPLTTALLAVPRSKVVRGFSFFGVSFVYVVFEDGTDIYWARSRVLEYLNFAQKRLPAGVTPSLGPDATGVGWVFEYVVLGAKQTLAELRAIQDWFVRYQLTKAEGVAEVASVELGPDERRGLTELDGEGEVVSGIVLQRDGANALAVIKNIKQKISEIAGSLPESVKILPVYDRSNLIYRAIDTLKNTLLEESIIVALVCMIFLLHVRSALVAIIMLPVGVLIAFMIMHALGISSNIMSLGGIAIAIGAMVDAAIVMIENAHKRLERAGPDADRIDV